MMKTMCFLKMKVDNETRKTGECLEIDKSHSLTSDPISYHFLVL